MFRNARISCRCCSVTICFCPLHLIAHSIDLAHREFVCSRYLARFATLEERRSHECDARATPSLLHHSPPRNKFSQGRFAHIEFPREVGPRFSALQTFGRLRKFFGTRSLRLSTFSVGDS